MDNVLYEEPFDFRPYGDAIKKARKEKGWSRERLSEETGISIAYLSEIENKGQAPSFAKIVSLSKILGFSIEEIIFSDCPDYKKRKTIIRYKAEDLLNTMSEKEVHILVTGLTVANTLEAI